MNTKRFLLTLVMTAAVTQAMGQSPTVLQLGERLPNLYYWDTNWYDSKVALHPEYSCYYKPANLVPSDYVFLGRPCVTDVPMKVIGVAAPVQIYQSSYMQILDTVLSHRVPEYFRLYQMEKGDQFTLLGEVRWDTIVPQYKMIIPCNQIDTMYDLYLAYFDEPAIVYDTFVVGGTSANNRRHGEDSDMCPEEPWKYSSWWDYPLTLYGYTTKAKVYDYIKTYPPEPNFTVVKHLSPSPDTSFHICIPYHTDEYWLPFFAIFDTNYVPGVGTYTDSCTAPTGLQVESMNPEGVTLSWDAGGNTLWQLAVVADGEDIESAETVMTPVNYRLLTDLDTGQWYVARVRTFCDTDVFGPWTDTLRFYVPWLFDTCARPTWLHVTALDSATVTLAWNATEALAWEVNYGPYALGLNGGQTATVEGTGVTLDGLYVDTWYWARVRALCDTDFWSFWTDTVLFHVPLHHVGDTTTRVITPVEQYTYLMPNPAREEVTVASSFRVKAVELYGADGKLLQHKEVNAVGTTMDLKGLPAGIYFVRVHTTAGVTTKRLIIE